MMVDSQTAVIPITRPAKGTAREVARVESDVRQN